MATIILKDKRATESQIALMSQAYGTYIKVVVDLEKAILAGGAEMHYEEEQELLEYGCNQSALWGGGVDLETGQIDYNSMINIRPNQGNPSREIMSSDLREKFDKIVKKILL